MLRAIIVDDEWLSVKRLNRILTETGTVNVCKTFLDPLEAYDYARENPLDIVFMDISMPEVDGMSLTARLRAHDQAIHIVFVTGYDEYAVQAFDMNALDYLMKPVTTERVVRTLERARNTVVKVNEPLLSVCLFNGLQVYQQDESRTLLRLRSPKTEELFAYLFFKGKVSRDEIIDTLWGGLEPEKAIKNLNSTLYYIRKAISENQLKNPINAHRKEIWIEEEHTFCDLYEFRRLVKQIKQEEGASLLNLIKQAEDLYTGTLLKSKGYEWATAHSRQIEREFIELLELAGKHYSESGQPSQALHYFETILKLDPLREDISLEAIRMYIANGRMNEAVRQYRSLEQMLKQELGTLPDPRIAEAIRNGDPLALST